MLKENQLKILLYVYDNEQIPISKIARTLKINYRIVHHFVNQLEKQGYLTSRTVRPVRIVKLHDDISVSQLTEIETYKRNVFLTKHLKIKTYLTHVLEEAENPFLILVIFGSYAKGTQKKSSDLDIAAIIPSKKDKKGVERAIKSGASYNYLKVQEYIFTLNEFKEMIKAKEENVGKQIIKNHIIVSNAENFVRIMELWSPH